jgi:hypothetical protein
MKGKTELLINCKWILKMSIPTVEMLQKEMQSLCNFSFLKIVKIELANKVQSFFLQKEMPSVPLKQHFSFLSLHFTKAFLVGMDLSNMAQILFIF